jgi:hypothetical protein
VSAGLCKQQDDFAREPILAPIKTHLTPELANPIFHNACAEGPLGSSTHRNCPDLIKYMV